MSGGVATPAERRRVVVRETAISVVINTVLSIAFFLLVFGWGRPVALGAMATDFLPQAFMVALMGTLVPSLLLRRHGARGVGAIVLRSVLVAGVALVLAGGGALLLCRAFAPVVLAPPAAIALRAAYGAVLAAVVTPLALRALFRSARRA